MFLRTEPNVQKINYSEQMDPKKYDAKCDRRGEIERVGGEKKEGHPVYRERRSTIIKNVIVRMQAISSILLLQCLPPPKKKNESIYGNTLANCIDGRSKPKFRLISLLLPCRFATLWFRKSIDDTSVLTNARLFAAVLSAYQILEN